MKMRTLLWPLLAGICAAVPLTLAQENQITIAPAISESGCIIIQNADHSLSIIDPQRYTWEDCFVAYIRENPVDHYDEYYARRGDQTAGAAGSQMYLHRHRLGRI